MTTAIVLASGSASRRRMLEAAGVPFGVELPSVDEAALKLELRDKARDGADMARRLAAAKAVSVSWYLPGALVIGADQVLLLDGQPMDKPADRAEAGRQLRALRARTHWLVTAAVVAEDARIVWRRSERASLLMRDFSESFLESYLEAEGAGVAESVGGYKLEGRGAQLFSRVQGDFFGILGLPLVPLLAFLRTRGALPE